jgi:hypothetical protein
MRQGDGADMSLIQNPTVTFADGPQLDAFGRVRTSETAQRFDIEFIYDTQPLLADIVTAGGATVEHDGDSRDLLMSIVNTSAVTSGAVYSHYDIPYTAGNSQVADITGTLNAAGLASGTVFLFVRSKVTGTVAEVTYQEGVAWTAAGAAVDWSKSQIFALDFQSLKVGRIRFALVRNGVAVPLLEVHNDNVRATGYWQTPTLPQYWRIYNDATYTYCEMGYGDTDNAIGLRFRVAANANATMRAICATVKSEGGENLIAMPGYPFAISNRATAVTVGTTLIPLLSIRPAALYKTYTNRTLIIPEGYTIDTDNAINYRIIYRPTLTGASWAAVNAESAVEYDVSATAISGGVEIEDDFVGGNNRSVRGQAGLLERLIMALGRTGTADILAIAAVRTGAQNATARSGLKWKEIR